MYIQSCKK